MGKTKKLLTGLFAGTFAAGMAGCGAEDLPPEPQTAECDDWDWDSDLGVYVCDDDDSSYRGSYFHNNRYYKNKSNLLSSSSYKSYKSSSSFKGFGSGSKGGFGG